MADSEKVSSLPSERAAILRAMAEKWHDEETLGDSTCDHRELEIHAYIAGYSAASAGRQELLEALIDARSIVHEYGEEMGAGPLTGIGQALQQYDALIAKHGG